MTTSEIWNILNEAVKGKIPVYELASACKGLNKETIYELGEKISEDMHHLGFNRKSYQKMINKKQFEKRIKEVNEL